MMVMVYVVSGSGDSIVIGAPGTYVPLVVPEADVDIDEISNSTVVPVQVVGRAAKYCPRTNAWSQRAPSDDSALESKCGDGSGRRTYDGRQQTT